jgi:hypothetical protein
MNTFLMFFIAIRCLAILMPPLVDPVLPPANISKNIRIIPDRGHTIKSSFANPVQVIIEITWK